jgi:hypothetical protein
MEGLLQGVHSHPSRVKLKEFVARCAQSRYLAKYRRSHSEKFRVSRRNKSKRDNLELCMQGVHIVRKECVTEYFDSEAQEE